MSTPFPVLAVSHFRRGRVGEEGVLLLAADK